MLGRRPVLEPDTGLSDRAARVLLAYLPASRVRVFTPPVCAHGRPMRWKTDRRRRAGGYWVEACRR